MMYIRIETSFREYVDGCYSSPVAYIEGIYVTTKYRQQDIARQLSWSTLNLPVEAVREMGRRF